MHLECFLAMFAIHSTMPPPVSRLQLHLGVLSVGGGPRVRNWGYNLATPDTSAGAAAGIDSLATIRAMWGA